jgi:glycosyltransferase involved in cell wall biosynthesis
LNLAMPRVSVIIPAFNRTHTLERALASVRAQNWPDPQVILGDDASTDGTPELARALWPGIEVVILPQNRGAAAARNAALTRATGDYLAFLDSDDEWLPGKLAAQVEFLQNHPDVGVCATGHLFRRADGVERTVKGATSTDWARTLLAAQPFHGASTPVVRRTAWEAVGGQDEDLRVLEDWDWMLRLARAFPLHVLPEAQARIHENRPSNPGFTLAATRRFLQKHETALRELPRREARRIASQHWENAGRNQILHGRCKAGASCFWRSFLLAPTRQPALPAAFPLLLWDGMTGRHDLARLLARRSGATWFAPGCV